MNYREKLNAGLFLRALVATAAVGAIMLIPAATAGAANPGTQGPPSQSCQNVVATPGGTTPGNATSLAKSPGTPFNITTGGISGSNYNPGSQYDVACFQVSQH